MTGKIIAVDFDNTLCSTDVYSPLDPDRYIIASPIPEMIKFVNELYESGHTIIIYTARGQLSCEGDLDRIEKKYRNVSEEWLKNHGVKYHELRFGKMYFDHLIDDCAWNVNSAIQELQYLKG